MAPPIAMSWMWRLLRPRCSRSSCRSFRIQGDVVLFSHDVLFSAVVPRTACATTGIRITKHSRHSHCMFMRPCFAGCPRISGRGWGSMPATARYSEVSHYRLTRSFSGSSHSYLDSYSTGYWGFRGGFSAKIVIYVYYLGHTTRRELSPHRTPKHTQAPPSTLRKESMKTGLERYTNTCQSKNRNYF